MTYDEAMRRCVITFPNGRELAVGDVTLEQAQKFLARHAGEFQRRDCVLHTVDGTFTREGDANG
jgi:hypothetical protein